MTVEGVAVGVPVAIGVVGKDTEESLAGRT